MWFLITYHSCWRCFPLFPGFVRSTCASVGYYPSGAEDLQSDGYLRFMKRGCTADIWINILLWILGWIPGE